MEATGNEVQFFVCMCVCVCVCGLVCLTVMKFVLPHMRSPFALCFAYRQQWIHFTTILRERMQLPRSR